MFAIITVLAKRCCFDVNSAANYRGWYIDPRSFAWVSGGEYNMSTTHQENERSELSPSLVWRRRFREVATSLRAIERGDFSPKELHQLRIACRRSDAVLRLSRDGAKSGAWRWLRRNLHSLRQSTNALRDDDVLSKWLAENETLSSRLRRKLSRDRGPLSDDAVARVRWLLQRDRLARRARKVHRRMKSLDGDAEFSSVFGRGLFRELSRFIEVLPTARMSSDKLHQTRIACKRLRYAIDAVAEIRPSVELGELNEMLKALQKHLGSIHDGVVQQRRLKQLGAERIKNRDPANKTADRKEKLNAFRTWWQTQPLERILADAMAEIVSLMRTGQLDAP